MFSTLRALSGFTRATRATACSSILEVMVNTRMFSDRAVRLESRCKLLHAYDVALLAGATESSTVDYSCLQMHAMQQAYHTAASCCANMWRTIIITVGEADLYATMLCGCVP